MELTNQVMFNGDLFSFNKGLARTLKKYIPNGVNLIE